MSLELKEAETCHLFEERQKFCSEEMDGLKQRCTTQLREVSQMNAKTHQALQLQVCYLQVSSNLTPQLCYLSLILHLFHSSSYDAVNALIYLRNKALGGVYLAENC